MAILFPEHLQNDMLIESAWHNADIARKAYSRMVMNGANNTNHIVMEFCIFCFDITSHPSTKHALLLSVCCFEINRCLTFYFDKIFWSNSNMQ